MAAHALDLEAMKEDELFELLGRLYGEFLERLDNHLDIGEGDPEADKTGSVSSPVRVAIEAGIFLAMRLERLSHVFVYGVHDGDGLIVGREGETWCAGVNKFLRELQNEASRPGEINAS